MNSEEIDNDNPIEEQQSDKRLFEAETNSNLVDEVNVNPVDPEKPDLLQSEIPSELEQEKLQLLEQEKLNLIEQEKLNQLELEKLSQLQQEKPSEMEEEQLIVMDLEQQELDNGEQTEVIVQHNDDLPRFENQNEQQLTEQEQEENQDTQAEVEQEILETSSQPGLDHQQNQQEREKSKSVEQEDHQNIPIVDQEETQVVDKNQQKDVNVQNEAEVEEGGDCQQQDALLELQEEQLVKEENQDKEIEVQGQNQSDHGYDLVGEQGEEDNRIQEEQYNESQQQQEPLQLLQEQNFNMRQQIEENKSGDNEDESQKESEIIKLENAGGLLMNILSDDSRYSRIQQENAPNIPCHFLGGKSLQLTNINDTSRLFLYFLGQKILRQLLNKANTKLKDIYKKSNDVKDFTIDEIQVYQALKIVMGLQQNSSSFDFFLLKDLQKIPSYSQLFTSERFQFLLECEKELNKDILNNDQLISEYVQRAQQSQTSDQELVLISKKNKPGEEIVHNNAAYTQVYLCELTSSFVFGYFVVKDINSFANQICINLENFTNQNHHIYLQNEEFISNVDKIQELVNHKIHISSFYNNKFDQIPEATKNEMLHNKPIKPKSAEVIFDRSTQTQFLIKADENSKKEVFLTTSGTVKHDKQIEKHKQSVQKVIEKLRKQLTDYRFINLLNEQCIFEEMSEIAIQNSFIIYNQAKEKIDYRLFRFKLAQELLSKQTQKLKQEELLTSKSKLIDVEVQTDNVFLNPENDNLVSKSPKIKNVNNQQYSLAEENQKLTPHVQKKHDKQGICLVCLQEKNVQNNTFVICQECTIQNKKPVYLCEKCFDAYHDDINVNKEGFDKKQFQRLSNLKNTLQTVPIDKMNGKPVMQNGQGVIPQNGQGNLPMNIPQANNGYNGYNGYQGQQQQQQQQQPIRRRRVNLQDGYETSGPTFNQQNSNMGGQNMPLKRRGVALDDPGFRSDAPSNYLPATRGRKRVNAGQNQFGYNDMGQQNQMNNANGYGQGLNNNSNGYERYQRGVDMNGYTTSDATYGRNNYQGDNYNNQIFRVAPQQRN